MAAPEKTPASGQSVSQAAAASVTPDPVTADLLAKHSAGQKLSPAEYGKLGAFKAKLSGLFGGKGGAPGQPAPGQPGNAAPVGTVAPGQAPANGLAPVPPDPRLAQRTTGVLLNRCDAVTARWITRKAQRAGATDQTVRSFDAKARFQKDDRDLLIELSPDVAAELGINPKEYALWVFGGTIGLHITELWLLADDLERTAEKLLKAQAAQAPAPAGTAPANGVTMQPGPGPTLPEPARPKGAPPIVT